MSAPSAVLFDLFGTLLDVTLLRDPVAPFCDAADRLVATWRLKQLHYSWAATAMGVERDFDALTADALDYALATERVVVAANDRRALLDAWTTLRPYDDAVPALDALRDAGLPCYVLTNATAATAERALRNAGLRERIVAAFSVGVSGRHKPAPEAYAVATSALGCAPGDLVLVSSNAWDATGAAQFGMRVAWCNRLGAPAETFGPPPAWTAASLPALAGLVPGG
jgi:2-haloacid dehalogenase